MTAWPPLLVFIIRIFFLAEADTWNDGKVVEMGFDLFFKEERRENEMGEIKEDADADGKASVELEEEG